MQRSERCKPFCFSRFLSTKSDKIMPSAIICSPKVCHANLPRCKQQHFDAEELIALKNAWLAFKMKTLMIVGNKNTHLLACVFFDSGLFHNHGLVRSRFLLGEYARVCFVNSSISRRPAVKMTIDWSWKSKSPCSVGEPAISPLYICWQRFRWQSGTAWQYPILERCWQFQQFRQIWRIS